MSLPEFEEGDRVVGLAAYPDYDSELVEGDVRGEIYQIDSVRPDVVVVETQDGLIRSVIRRTATRVENGDVERAASTARDYAEMTYEEAGYLGRLGNSADLIAVDESASWYASQSVVERSVGEEAENPFDQPVDNLDQAILAAYGRPTDEFLDEVEFAATTRAWVTKSTGEKAAFANGGVRDTEVGKPRFDLLRPTTVPYADQMLTRFAALMARGAEKYSSRNWEQFSDTEALQRARSSAARHFEQWLSGERDEDHAAAVWFNIMAAEYIEGVLSGLWPALEGEEA